MLVCLLAFWASDAPLIHSDHLVAGCTLFGSFVSQNAVCSRVSLAVSGTQPLCGSQKSPLQSAAASWPSSALCVMWGVLKAALRCVCVFLSVGQKSHSSWRSHSRVNCYFYVLVSNRNPHDHRAACFGLVVTSFATACLSNTRKEIQGISGRVNSYLQHLFRNSS